MKPLTETIGDFFRLEAASGVLLLAAALLAPALFIPMRGRQASDPSPLRQLEHDLHPAVAYAILRAALGRR